MNIDYEQVADAVTVSGEDTEGSYFSISGVVIPIVVSDAEVGPLLAGYDPANPASPSAADSRVIARVVLDALQRKAG